MQYKTLYRKYRPKHFDEVSGQKIAIKILQNSVINNQIAHAYLFYGIRGTGKTTLAKIFSRAVNCLNNTNGNPCEKCENCLLTKENENLDIIEIDAASNNGVEQIRELNDKVKYLPSSLKYKVYIVDEVHMLTDSAFNALLKTLEEPPEHIIFILATTEYEKLPKTIISRCQTIEFKKIDDQSMINKLKEIAKKEKIKITDEALEEITLFSGGGLRDAIGFLDKASSYEEKEITCETIREMFSSLTNKDIKELVDLLDNNESEILLTKLNEHFVNGADPILLASNIMNYIRINMINNKDFSSEKCDEILKLDNMISLMKQSENPKIIFEVSLINMSVPKEKFNTTFIIEEEQNKPEEKEIIIIEEFIVDDKLKNIRVNNTLCDPKRDLIVKFRKGWSDLNSLNFGDENLLKTLYYDVKPVAASKTNVVLMSKELGTAARINDNIEIIEQMFNKMFGENHKLVCISEKEWDIYKNKYEKDKNAFKYVEEKEEKKKEKDTLTNKVDKLFGKVEDGE